jgi:spore coat protein CotH
MTLGEMASGSNKKVVIGLKRLSRPLRGIWPRAAEAVLGLLALTIVGFAVLTYVTPLARLASGFVAGNKYTALVEGFLNPFRNRQLLLKSGLPIYDLEIDREQFALVEEAVAKARKQGLMTEDMQVWADARFFYEGVPYNVKIRVRGDLPGHWEGSKKSWRIKFGSQKIEYNGATLDEPIYFQGKRQINLIIPQDRDYVVAPFVNALMQEAGLTIPRDQFAILRINGVLQGLYYEVEHFDKPMLAAQHRPETTILGQNSRAMHFEQYTKYGTPITADARYDLGTVSLQIEDTGELAMQAQQAIQVLLDHSLNPTPANFRRVRAVMDWEKYLRFRNITTLFNTNHVRFGSDNLKLFFDTSRGLLEPIPWDVHLVRMPTEPGTIDYWNSHGPDEIQRATLLDPELRLQRNQLLWEWVSDGGDGLIAKYNDFHEKIRPLAWADVLNTPVQAFKMDELKKDFEFNVHRVYKVLQHSSADFTYRLETHDRAALEMTALNFSGVLLKQIELSDPAVLKGTYQLYEDLNDNGELDPGDPLVAEKSAVKGVIRFDLEKYVLPEVRYDSDSIDGRYWEYMDTLSGRSRFFLAGQLAPAKRHPLAWTPPVIEVGAENAVSGQAMPSALIDQTESLPPGYTGITSYDASAPFDLAAPELTTAEFLRAHPEFKASPKRPNAVELSGRVTLAGAIIVPKSTMLILKPGVDITMQPETSLLAYGGLTAIGQPEQRIRIHGDGSGDPWGVFAVIRPPEEVVLKYTDFQDGGQAQINSILFTGGFAVHEGDLHLEHCTFTDMQSEDGFNLKNGRIFMNDCVVAGSASDAVDIDFGVGEVKNSRFLNNVNDGLDISGSTVTIINNRFEHNGDKGVSVGENSHPILVNNLFHGNQIGLSSKDLSHAKIAYSTFVGNVLAIEAKRKKPFFGGGSADFINNVFAENQTFLEEDYFSKGQVSIQNSLTDDPGACPTCQTTDIHFTAPETGDYTLASDTAAQIHLAGVQVDWASLSEANHSPQLVGAWLH